MPVKPRAGSPHPYAKTASRVDAKPDSPISTNRSTSSEATSAAPSTDNTDKAVTAYVAHVISVERSTAEHFAEPGRSPPMSVGTRPEDLDWLEANAKAPGVISLPSGLQYKVLKAGAPAGAKSPKIGTRCEVRYTAKLCGSGVEFYNSKTKDNTSGLEAHTPNRIIRGWTLALQLMATGDKWRLFMPSELGYGDAGSTKNCWKGVPPGAALSFDIELCAVRNDSGKPESKQGGVPKVVRPAAMTHDEFLTVYAEQGGGSSSRTRDENVPYMGGHFEASKLFVRTRVLMSMLDGVHQLQADEGPEAAQVREGLRAKIFAVWEQAQEQLQRLDGAESFPSKHAKSERQG